MKSSTARFMEYQAHHFTIRSIFASGKPWGMWTERIFAARCECGTRPAVCQVKFDIQHYSFTPSVSHQLCITTCPVCGKVELSCDCRNFFIVCTTAVRRIFKR